MAPIKINRQRYHSEYLSFFQNDLWPFVESLLATVDNFKTDNSYFFVGNGASAAISSHLANDVSKALGCKAITFHDPALLTCFANDYGYEQWAAEAIKLYAEPGDVIFFISSSGRSANIINAANQAKSQGLTVILLTGPSPDPILAQQSDCHLVVQSQSYNVIECCHMSALCAAVDSVNMVHLS